MATRFNSVGFAGRLDQSTNSQDSQITTIEAPVTAVASAAQQNTGIALPNGGVQAVNAFLKVSTAEATGTTKTVSVGIFGGGGTEFINGADVASTGITGTTELKAVNTSSSTIGYTLGSANFAELNAVLVLTIAYTA